MATLIPSLNSCLLRMTSGERRVARALEGNLDQDYLPWDDVPIGSKRRQSNCMKCDRSSALVRRLATVTNLKIPTVP